MYCAHFRVTLTQFQNQVIFTVDFKINSLINNDSYISISEEFNDICDCINFVQNVNNTQKLNRISKLHLEINTKSEQEEIYYKKHKQYAICLKSQLLSRFLRYSNFITWFTLEIKLLFEIEDFTQNSAVNYNWKFAKRLELMKGHSPAELKSIARNEFQYLQYILLSFDDMNNRLMKSLSKAKWPNITRVNLLSHNGMADGIKYMRKHWFFKVERFLFCVQKVISEMAIRITKIDCMKVLILNEYDVKQQFCEQICIDVLVKRIVKSQMMDKYLLWIEQVSRMRQMINNEEQFCYIL